MCLWSNGRLRAPDTRLPQGNRGNDGCETVGEQRNRVRADSRLFHRISRRWELLFETVDNQFVTGRTESLAECLDKMVVRL